MDVTEVAAPQTLVEIEDQIAALKQRADELRMTERVAVIEAIKYQMTSFAITIAEIAAPKARKVAKGVPLYRDPATGKTWTGRGRRPVWCPQEKEASLFIDKPTVALAA